MSFESRNGTCDPGTASACITYPRVSSEVLIAYKCRQHALAFNRTIALAAEGRPSRSGACLGLLETLPGRLRFLDALAARQVNDV